MDNKSIAKIIEEIGTMIELTGGNPFKARAHYSAARTAEILKQPIEAMVENGTLGEIKGFGKAMVDKVSELVKTGNIVEYEELRALIPDGLFDILRLPGIGPKKVYAIHSKLQVATLGELEYACTENRLAMLDGFGQKTQDNILSGIEQLSRYKDRYLYSVADGEASALLGEILAIPNVERASVAGSIRRHCETVGNIDIVASVPEKERRDVTDRFIKLPAVEETIETGQSGAAVRITAGLNVKLRFASENEYPFFLHYFTGSKEYAASLKRHAGSMGLVLTESGIFNDETKASIPCLHEEDIFKTLNLAYIEPELRENLGEIDTASGRGLPTLVEEGDIKGILHIHTTYSDGKNSIEEMVNTCRNLGYEYIGICDHSKSAFYANGLSKERVLEQHKEIDALQKNYPDITLFKGIESDILQDGSLDYPEETLKLFDFVVASVHFKLTMSKSEATTRLERAIRNPYTTILGHPTGRLLLSREGYPLDWEVIFKTAHKCNVAMELNANPHRLDLDWRLCRRAKEMKVPIAVNTDAHHISGLDDIKYGVGIARKGWLGPADIISTLATQELKVYFKKEKKDL
ncbi:DNA polymerase/3'-5' exonuclease PolX [candidate division KSB1 bacterium]